jgi:hypothetical protein
MKLPLNQILKAWLLVGTLDILAACILVLVKSGKNPLIVLTFIASAIFGKDAYTGGAVMQVIGLVFHYFIALCFTVFFFFLYPRLKLLRSNVILTGIVYGLFVWCVMNLVVVPSTQITSRPFDLTNAIINMLILIACIGMPLALMAKKSYPRSVLVDPSR